MNCPYCGKEMEKGYLQARDGIAWNKKERRVAALSMMGSDLALAKASGIYSGAVAIAYNCKECKKIIVDYENGCDKHSTEEFWQNNNMK